MSKTANAEAILKGAHIAANVFQLRPDYRALLMVVEGIPPGPSDSTSEALLQEAEASARESLSRQAVTEIPHVAAWRDTYKAFGAKPKKERNSLESLMRRAEGGLPRVNRLTDIYNAISIKHQIPLGGEDLDKYSGLPKLIRATGQEKFDTSSAGETVTELPPAGEVVWCDDAGVTCRRWNWRQCSRTALSDATTRILFILDALEPLSDNALEDAADELGRLLSNLSPDVRISRRVIRAS
ncbi:B3/B4 tRNA-binding domain-containing protein [Dothidotthia symphoricarpi CBS 119687]|uniref:B3/B4 tRNA-binding domain-containing protein n=1 Tax=Dothidotthia symphoricarpi CBS 119687 TaxID=1392245 RepID=A0A6A6A099_9PLEO|nr:B3/B4 tRNA-binding domain-containing protein [Dothidotthia symphoricarpi CBS 119687]KAF2124946.1 B3/B4 tRNA-binding domain-containing protein [Dothidotthia symphoricarpi CBS 119687]